MANTYGSPWSNMIRSGRGATVAQSQVPQAVPPVVKPVPQPKKEPATFLYGEIARVHGSCGLGVLYSFKHLNSREYPNHHASLENNLENNPGGCGFLTAAFIDNSYCKEMFLLLKSKFPILYQSEIRHNTNSGNNFFFCIFDTGENEEKIASQVKEELGYPLGFKNGLEW